MSFLRDGKTTDQVLTTAMGTAAMRYRVAVLRVQTTDGAVRQHTEAGMADIEFLSRAGLFDDATQAYWRKRIAAGCLRLVQDERP